MQPYSYQQDCLDALDAARKKRRKKALIVMATGLGKTVVSAFEVQRLLKKAPGRVLYLCHQNDILHQAREEYEEVLDGSHTYGYFHGSEKHLHRVDVLFASFQTMANYRESFDPREFKYVIVDEVHHVHAATFRPTVEYFKPSFMIGLTATPERGDNLDITTLLGQPVYRLGLFEALAKGYLCKVDYRLMTDEVQNLEVLETPVGKLSIAELNRTVFVPKRDEEIVRIIKEKTEAVSPHRVMIFCPSIEYAERLAEMMPHATIVHAELRPKKERRSRLDAFRRGKVSTILTVDMLNEGIDVPQANVIVFLRSTSSKTIFLQQLGRGLRRAEGKKNVLVLDFVANCERIEMIDELNEGVKAVTGSSSYGPYSHDGSGLVEPEENGAGDGPLTIDIDGVQFDERLIKLVKVVSEIKEGYTEEALLQQLCKLAEKLGRVPMSRDVTAASKRGECAAAHTFTKTFGSWAAALEAAGMIPTRNARHVKESLIQQLQDLAEKLGRVPMSRDVTAASKRGECVSPYIFRSVFGSLSAALEAADMVPNMIRSYSREMLILMLQDLAEKLGHVPTRRDVARASKRGECASVSTFMGVFGSWEAALEAADMVPNKTAKYTQEVLVSQLENLADRLGRTITGKDVAVASKCGECASVIAFVRAFGSWEAALEAADMVPNMIRSYSREMLILMLQDLAEKLGHVPTQYDVHEASKRGECASYKAFMRAFGSLSAALEAAGMQSYRKRR